MAEGFITRKGGGGGAEEEVLFNLGPGPTTPIAGSYVAGFFGEVSQSDFGITMTQVMSDLNITEGTAQNTSEPLLKFIHNGKIKYINKKNIRNTVGWNHIASKINLYGGTTMTFGGNSYKVRLMRGWGQVSGSESSLTTPDFENGPLYTYNYSFGTGGNSGVNWPTDTSDWSANNPNEWNTLIFPIHEDSSSQSQTGNVPDWASYSNSDLNIDDGSGYEMWCQETADGAILTRGGFGGLASISDVFADFFEFGYDVGLRLVFELI